MAGRKSSALTGAAHNKVRALKMSDQVAAKIRQMIARGQLADGDWLPTETELLTQFGVSRPTLREAFRLLEADSLVSIRRGPPGGARITLPGPAAAADLFGLLLTLSGTTIGDVWDARMAIEPPAVRQLTANATKATLAELDRELEIVRAAADDPHSLNTAGVRFHVRLVELSGNKTLTTVIGMLSEIIERELANTLADVASDTNAVKRAKRRALGGYEEVVRVIHSHDADLAEATWRKHLQSARRYLTKSQSDGQVIDLLY